MNFKSYSNYKYSGISWIGDIPEQWEVTRLKFLITKNAQYGANCEPETDETKFDYRYVRITDIDDNASLKNNIVYLSSEDAKGFILQEGDVLFARSGATVGKTYLYNKNDGLCCYAGYLIRYIPNLQILYPKFLLYFSFTKSYTEWIKIVSTQATIQNVSADKYDNLILPLPCIQEQKQIGNYLDKQTAKIDETIVKNQQLIELLQEKRTALINHVVTKGLNLDAPMKDSDIDIIGSIPENNDIVRLKFLCDIKTGDKDTVNKNPDGKYLFYVRSPIVERIDTYSFDGEAVLMAGDGVGAGKVFHYATGKFDYHQRVYNLHNFKHVLPKFIYYYMSSLFSIEIEKGSAKSTVDSVRLPMLEDFFICYPSINEQKRIIEYLDNKTSIIDTIISKVKLNLNLLEEYKTSLIHHVVTGKIDVRGEEI